MEAKKLRNGDDACLLSFSPFENFLLIGLKSEKPGLTTFRVVNMHEQTYTSFDIVNELEANSSLSSVVWTEDELYFLTSVEGSNCVHLFGRNVGRLFKEREREEK